MQNPFAITDTYELLPVVEQIKLPSRFLTELFFPNALQTMSDVLALEYTKQHRRLAPYVTRRSRGVNMSRESSAVKLYKAPLIGAKRVIGIDDISRRVIGETPVYSTMTAQDRAAQLQATDLRDLLNMLENRREEMSAELLTTGKVTVKAFADDGKLSVDDEIEFTAGQPVNVTTAWDNANADIFGDLKTTSEAIQEDAGIVPTVMVCGANVESYLLGNAAIKDWLSIPNRETLTMMSLRPHYTNPQVRFIGRLDALNLEIYSYAATYLDEATGQAKPFLGADTAIIGAPGRGKFMYGAVNFLDQGGQWQSVSASNVPVYNFNTEAQTTSLTLFSACLPVPDVVEDFVCLKVK